MSGSPSGSPTLVSLDFISAQHGFSCGYICSRFLSDARQQSFRGPRRTTRTAWPWRCSSFSSSTITPLVSTSPSSKGKRLAFLDRPCISWESTETRRYSSSISLSSLTHSALNLDPRYVSCSVILVVAWSSWRLNSRSSWVEKPYGTTSKRSCSRKKSEMKSSF